MNPPHSKVVVKTLTGKIIQLPRINFATTTVAALKMLVQDEEGIPPDQQRLIFAGKQLKDDRTLLSYGVEEDSIIHLMLHMRCTNNDGTYSPMGVRGYGDVELHNKLKNDWPAFVATVAKWVKETDA